MSSMTSRSPGRSFWRRFAHQTEVGAECAWFTAPIPSKTPLTAHPELSFLGKKMGDQLWQRRVCLRLCPQEGVSVLLQHLVGEDPSFTVEHQVCLAGRRCFSSVQFSSVTQSCLTLWDPMNHSTPGLPVHHHLPEFTQTHVH